MQMLMAQEACEACEAYEIGSAYSDLLPLCLKVQHLGPTEYREEVSSPEDERPIHSSVALIRSDKGSSYLLR